MSRHGGRGTLCAPALVVVALAVSGCSGGGPGTEAPSAEPSDYGLSGPWAQEFAEALADDPSPFERGVLEDGSVTEDEVAEAHHRMQRCMKDSRLVISWFDDGGFEVGGVDGGAPPYSSDRTNELLRSCERRWDNSTTFLFEQIRRNPEKQDDAEITVACLRAAGLVGRSYSVRQYRAEDDEGVYSYDEWSAGAVQCRLDPLGLWRER